MYAACAQPLFMDASGISGLWRRSRFVGYLIAAFGFFGFFPYPAVALGHASALQIGNVLALLLALPLLVVGAKGRPLFVSAMIMLPLLVSALRVGLAGDVDAGLPFKEITVWASGCLAMLVTQLYAPRYGGYLVGGIAAATLIHAGIGALQVHQFVQGVFPLPWLYQNQSFLSVAEHARELAQYEQRPFGLFPEPSAMSSCLAPWIVLWVAQCSGAVWLNGDMAHWRRTLYAAAAIGGLALLLASRSGNAVVLVAALVPLGLLALICSKANSVGFAAIVMASIISVGVITATAAVLRDRTSGRGMANSSWDERTASVGIGFSMVTEGSPETLVCGLGPGATAGYLRRAANIDAVFSVLLTYLYETGLIGVICVAAVALYLLRIFAQSHCRLALGLMTAVWLVGVSVITSYHYG